MLPEFWVNCQNGTVHSSGTSDYLKRVGEHFWSRVSTCLLYQNKLLVNLHIISIVII